MDSNTPQNGKIELGSLLEKIVACNENTDINLVAQAYNFSDKAHEGQLRDSGEPYINHCAEVAVILAELHLDSTTIAGGILHDVLEDSEDAETVRERLKKKFGNEIAELVEGLTRISELQFESREQQQADYFRKMLLSMTKDIRVILIKFADRLHNMRTLQYKSPERQKQIALETRDVYAPLAHRFGIAKIKWELEDLSLKYLDPEGYEDIKQKITQKRMARERFIDEVKRPIQTELKANGIIAEIIGRVKHFYSIYDKMQKRNKPFEEIYDLLAIRIVVDSIKDCYHVLGLVHSLFIPVDDRFKDFIATPKSNMYQSLHTTVVIPGGQMVEIQIRTSEMHRIAEEGIAAHWLYKEGKTIQDKFDQQVAWLRQVLDWQLELTDPAEFIDELKIELFPDEIFVFTPKGDLKHLPRGATPVDFAFAVHTDVGMRCAGAKVNRRIVPLNYTLRSGDLVEILTSSHHKPNRDWLNFVKTVKARTIIKRLFKAEEFEHSVRLGREILDKEVEKAKIKPTDEEMIHIAKEFSYSDLERFLAGLGSGEVSVIQVMRKLVKQPEDEEVLVVVPPTKERRKSSGIKIGSLDNPMIIFARCCWPIPGDDVLGFVTRGRGVSVHRVGCSNTENLFAHRERTIEVEWDPEVDRAFPTEISVYASDRKSLLSDITAVIGENGVNIINADVRTKGGIVIDRFEIELKNLQQLRNLVRTLQNVKGVSKVLRMGETFEEEEE